MADLTRKCCEQWLSVQDIKGLQERMRAEVQETFTEVLSSVAKDPAKNTGKALYVLWQQAWGLHSVRVLSS